MNGKLRVVKVGGSLFSLADLPTRLQAWTDLQGDGINVFLAGGGALADAVREWDGRFRLGEERSHWLCVELLDVAAKFLAALLPNSVLCEELATIKQARASGENRSFVFVPASFMRKQEAKLLGTRLDCSWAVTSDSIAARIAEVLKADELVLFKSKSPMVDSLEELSGGYVDSHFAAAARSLPRVRLVNLRDDAFAEMIVTP